MQSLLMKAVPPPHPNPKPAPEIINRNVGRNPETDEEINEGGEVSVEVVTKEGKALHFLIFDLLLGCGGQNLIALHRVGLPFSFQAGIIGLADGSQAVGCWSYT